ncbi:MAG: hypothetical protein NXI20_01630 [bacterium]|nr:hypothetical protein [bacterium]
MSRILLIILVAGLFHNSLSYGQLDVIHYNLKINPDIGSGTVKGEVIIDFEVPQEQDSVMFACGNMQIDEVNGKNVSSHYTDGNSLIIKLKKKRKSPLSINISYHGKPKNGMKFNSELNQVYTIYSTNEWMVCNDTFSDRATIEMEITVPEGLDCVGSGELQEIIESSDNRIFKWQQSYGTPFYTYGLAIGDFNEATDQVGDKELKYYSPVLTSEELKKLYLETPKMISFFEEKTGIEYPQKTYTQVLMGSFYQEMSGFAVFNEKYAESVFNDSSEIHLTGHELAHQWWGNMITCKNLQHFWLNEAFAVYMASAFHEVHFGPEKYEADIAIYKSIYDGLVKRGLDRSLIFEKWKPTRDNRGIAYYKGAYVLHLLRQELGDEAFWKGVKEYSQKYYGKFVETKDFQESMEQASEKDLSEFFEKWVHN